MKCTIGETMKIIKCSLFTLEFFSTYIYTGFENVMKVGALITLKLIKNNLLISIEWDDCLNQCMLILKYE